MILKYESYFEKEIPYSMTLKELYQRGMVGYIN